MILAWTSAGSGTPAISVTRVRSQSVVGWSVSPFPTSACTSPGSVGEDRRAADDLRAAHRAGREDDHRRGERPRAVAEHVLGDDVVAVVLAPGHGLDVVVEQQVQRPVPLVARQAELVEQQLRGVEHARGLEPVAAERHAGVGEIGLVHGPRRLPHLEVGRDAGNPGQRLGPVPSASPPASPTRSASGPPPPAAPARPPGARAGRSAAPTAGSPGSARTRRSTGPPGSSGGGRAGGPARARPRRPGARWTRRTGSPGRCCRSGRRCRRASGTGRTPPRGPAPAGPGRSAGTRRSAGRRAARRPCPSPRRSRRSRWPPRPAPGPAGSGPASAPRSAPGR